MTAFPMKPQSCVCDSILKFPFAKIHPSWPLRRYAINGQTRFMAIFRLVVTQLNVQHRRSHLSQSSLEVCHGVLKDTVSQDVACVN